MVGFILGMLVVVRLGRFYILKEIFVGDYILKDIFTGVVGGAAGGCPQTQQETLAFGYLDPGALEACIGF